MENGTPASPDAHQDHLRHGVLARQSCPVRLHPAPREVQVVSSSAPSDAQLRLEGTGPVQKKELSQWWTPQPLANRIAEWCVQPGATVLEPCAGSGNLLRACLAFTNDVTGFEIDQEWFAVAAAETTVGASLTCLDFMAEEPDSSSSRDIVVMNPPYEKGQDAAWIAHAIMFAPRVVALVPSRTLYGAKKHRQIWSRYRLARVAHLVRRPIFKGAGGKFDLCVVDVRREPPSLACEVSWWL